MFNVGAHNYMNSVTVTDGYRQGFYNETDLHGFTTVFCGSGRIA
jgi:hypothetical protein